MAVKVNTIGIVNRGMWKTVSYFRFTYWKNKAKAAHHPLYQWSQISVG